MTVREQTEQIEAMTLSQFATPAVKTLGRAVPEAPCPLRTSFQRDRDRILHCKAFRRLKHKTQVFISPEGDHYRTRLTHTLEVSQIARTISRALRLNEDLTEAIALGHDLGHTPFGHAGERALNEISPRGFRHYEQSVRVAERLERDGAGLNLCREVLDGFARHTTGEQPSTFEGRVVRLSDRIAYISHDIDDACRAGVLSERDIPRDIRACLGESHSARINTLIGDTVTHSIGGSALMMSDTIQEAFDAIHEFLFERVYNISEAKREEAKVANVIRQLYDYFTGKPDRLPADFRDIAVQDGLDTAVCDFIAGMSDHYAIETFTAVFIPDSWKY
ncbi:MAG: deoxyguanosinetriphosphate triphosphohydrolase [Clostridia bacterium]|nr:deoxyguanosinetriphosphate triphosphohydrolase [Clostridia bacterium]